MDHALSERLDKIRSQANSKLQNQSNVFILFFQRYVLTSKLARTLVAVDDVLQEQSITASATAYLVTLVVTQSIFNI
jgi:hypothetical protein